MTNQPTMQCLNCGSPDHADCATVPVGATVLTPDTLKHLADLSQDQGQDND